MPFAPLAEVPDLVCEVAVEARGVEAREGFEEGLQLEHPGEAAGVEGIEGEDGGGVEFGGWWCG